MQPRMLLAFFAATAHLLARGQLADHQEPKALLCRAALQLFGPQCVLVHEVIPPQVQDFAFPFVELH